MNAEPVSPRLPGITPTISAGILTANLLSLGTEIALLEQAGVKMVHFDVMDGCFTPIMTFGPPIIRAVRTSMLKDVHLMIDQPLEKLADYVNAGADIITVHLEATIHPHRALQQLAGLKSPNQSTAGLIRGVAVNPGTPIEALEPLLDELELILILAVNPGWSGQRFIKTTSAKIAKAKDMIKRSGRNILLTLDGGITRDNIDEIAAMGADIVVTGSAIFDGKSAANNARFMLERLQRQ